LYDSPESAASIPSFVTTYSLDTSELLEPDVKKYKTFNEFFSRKLRPDARPVDNADDPLAICSAADCRLTVYQTVDLAKEFWIKGREFTIPNLLGVTPSSVKVSVFDGASLAIFRLAPADYHRFHCPIDCTVGEIVHIPGQYYTVNPQAVNEPGFDVFTANTRSVLYLTHAATGLPVAFVAIGALLVGSIGWTNGGEPGKTVKKGEELGCVLVPLILIHRVSCVYKLFCIWWKHRRSGIPQGRYRVSELYGFSYRLFKPATDSMQT
jgi:phosphatidylserine decarboxylase